MQRTILSLHYGYNTKSERESSSDDIIHRSSDEI